MGLVRMWRRDLFPAERRVALKVLEEQWDTAESVFVTSLSVVLQQMLDRLLDDVQKILEGRDFGALKDIKIGYRDKMVNIIRQQLVDDFKMGKGTVYQEFSVRKDVTIPDDSKDYFSAKAEAIVTDISEKIKTTTIFVVLAGIKSNKSDAEIMFELKGKSYDNKQLAETDGIRELIGKTIATAALINVAEAVNEGRESGFQDIRDQIGAYQWSAILDERTCKVCEELDGKYFEPDDPSLRDIRPPLHPACRCILVAVLKEELKSYPVTYSYLTNQQVFDFTAYKFW